MKNITKQCNKCKYIKKAEEFYKRNGGKYLTSICKKCDIAGRKSRREKSLGRELQIKPKKYSKKELNLLLKLYENGKSLEEIAKYFPDRTRRALESKISDLGKSSRLKRFSKDDISFIKASFYKKSLKEIAVALNRTEKSIEHQARKLKLIYRKETYIEKQLKEWLNEYGITFKAQKRTNKFIIDFLCGNTAIEVQGSYWHCDPKVFKDGPINETQKNNIIRDSNKKNTY
jgi:hypothetical protein